MKLSYSILLLFLQSISILTFSQEFIKIEARVIDKNTQKGLEYASVGIKNTHIGTITNEAGYFTLFVPDSLRNDTVAVFYLGYSSYVNPIKSFNNRIEQIKLSRVNTEIEAVEINPLTPELVLQKIMEYYDDNYPQEPFLIEGFYLEELVENQKHIEFVEAYVNIYSPSFSDTGKCQASLIQGRTKEELGELQFMKRFSDKKQAKKTKKAIRRGDTVLNDNPEGINIVFGGPKTVLTEDAIRNLKTIYSNTKLKKFELDFGSSTWYGGRELYTLNIYNKKAIDNVLIRATLFVDKETFAIISIKSNIGIVMPKIVKPVLRLYRIKLYELNINLDTEYELFDSIWYPKKTIFSGYVEANKKYRGNYQEYSKIEIKKAFVATNLKSEDIAPIEKEQQLSDEPLKLQLKEHNPDFWMNKNRIKYDVTIVP